MVAGGVLVGAGCWLSFGAGVEFGGAELLAAGVVEGGAVLVAAGDVEGAAVVVGGAEVVAGATEHRDTECPVTVD